jgi:hypothetical protein
MTAMRNRNGNNITFVSMLWANGQWLARTRSADQPSNAIPARHTLVLAERLYLYGYRTSSSDHTEVQARQAAAFGQPFTDQQQSLRVGVVGCSGTGSPFSTLAARSGIGELVHIDKDKLSKNNLNRVRGFKTADIGKNKAIGLKEFIDSLGLSVAVAAYEAEVDLDANALDALASCDIIIGCTDDYCGRAVLNTAVYAYAQLLIDVGLGGRVAEDRDGQPMLRYNFGRISTILPEAGQCLFCQDVLRDVWIRTQEARRENPDISDEELKERYLEDGAAAAPGVGPFTNATADFAVGTLFDLIKPFRKFPPELRRDMFFIDFVLMTFRSHET